MYTTEMIELKFRNYTQLKQKLLLLQYELVNPVVVTNIERLEALAYTTSKNGELPVGRNSSMDKVLRLAASYRETARNMNEEVIRQILQEWNTLHLELSRVDAYMRLLDEGQRMVLQAYYIEGKPWKVIEKSTGYSRRTLIRRKNEGLEHLARMYHYTSQFVSK